MKTIQEQIAVMQAYAEGKQIESKSRNNGYWVDVESEPNWNWHCFDYRVKEEPHYRPFANAEECWNEMLKHEPFGWVIQNINGIKRHVNAIYCDCIAFVSYGGYTCSFESMKEEYTFIDGTPFGIKEE